ncbi:MAG: hypothetical protein JXA10_10995 [Anaerolineae bacterium]|nr:hypothetical protein [Anaerolineae bacterium]
MSDVISVVVSVLALFVSVITAWLTLLRKGTVRMTQPTVVYFGPDAGGKGNPKVFFRSLLYSTSKRGQVVESIFVKLKRGETSQTFNIWVYGEHSLSRGSGVYVGPEGLVCNHHFLLPEDGTQFQFLPGTYLMEIYVSLVGHKGTLLLETLELVLAEQHATILKDNDAGIYFDWGPDAKKYHAHSREDS